MDDAIKYDSVNIILPDADSKNIWKPPGLFHGKTHYLIKEDKGSDLPSTEKEIIICVHGIGNYHFIFDGIADFFSKHGYIVVYYDLIGRGYSEIDETNQQYGSHEHVEQLRDLIVGLGYLDRKINLIAHSMGGSLVTLYTSKYPENIKSLILLAPAGLMDIKLLYLVRHGCCLKNVLRFLFQNQINKRTSDQTWRYDIYNHKDNKEIEEDMVNKMWLMHDNSKTAFDAFYKSLLQFPLTKIDNEVKTVSMNSDLSVFIIWASNDIVVNAKHNSKRWKDILEKGKCRFEFTEMKESGHSFFLEYPNETNNAILSFLSNNNSTKDF